MSREPNVCSLCGQRFHCGGCFMFHRPYGSKKCKKAEQMEADGMFRDYDGRWKRAPVDPPYRPQ